MPRQPKPWYRADRDGWYAQIGGRQRFLGKTKDQADREFYRLMAAGGQLPPAEAGRMTVADACESYLADSQHTRANRANTLRIKTDALSAFAGAFGHRRLDAVQPAEVLAWLANYRGLDPGRQGFCDSSRALYFRIVKQLYRFARDTGVLATDPFARAICRWAIGRRDRPMTDQEYERIMAIPRLSAEFKRVIEFVWRCGMRPGEVCAVTARNLDARLPVVRFQAAEHKTGTKTGFAREVHVPADLWEHLTAMAAIHRQGPLIRKRNGTPWTQKQVSVAFNKLKKTHGLECVLYQARHRWVTLLLESGEDAHRVARMAGHASTNETLRTYYHPDTRGMVEAAERIMGEEAGRMQRERIAAREAAHRAEQEQRRAIREARYAERRRLTRRATAAPSDT